MAKVTTEDCRYVAGGRFKLVSVAAFRAKMLSKGAPAFVKTDNLRGTVVALREVAQLMIDCDKIEDEIVKAYQSHNMHHMLAEKSVQQELSYAERNTDRQGTQPTERRQMIDSDVYDLFMDVLGGADSSSIEISSATADSKVAAPNDEKPQAETELETKPSKRGSKKATEGGKNKRSSGTNAVDSSFAGKSNLYENV